MGTESERSAGPVGTIGSVGDTLGGRVGIDGSVVTGNGDTSRDLGLGGTRSGRDDARSCTDDRAGSRADGGRGEALYGTGDPTGALYDMMCEVN